MSLTLALAEASSMPRTLTEPSKRAIPVRACWKCDDIQDVFHLTMVGKHWLCAPCYRARRSTLVTPRTPQSALGRTATSDPAQPLARATKTERPISRTVAELERIDTVLRWTGIVLKTLFYLGCAQLAEQNELIRALMLGVLVGDSLVWVGQAWFDRRFHTLAVSTEALLYTIVFIVSWQAGMFEWPSNDICKAIATTAMLGTAALKALHFWRKLKVIES